MKEPYLTRFKQLILSGSASRDIHDAGDGPGAPGRGGERASAAFLMREVDRVRMHTAGLCVLLADHIATAAMVLDVGCGTGGTTVALALSALAPKQVIGVDADVSTLEAAEVRALGHDLEPQKVSFQHVPAGEPLPFASASFDLVTCVSVLEFITLPAARERFIRELLRVLRPGVSVPGNAQPVPPARLPLASLPRRLAAHAGTSLGDAALGDRALAARTRTGAAGGLSCQAKASPAFRRPVRGAAAMGVPLAAVAGDKA